MKLGLVFPVYSAFSAAALAALTTGCSDAARAGDLAQASSSAVTVTASGLELVPSFGDNPGGLTMYRHLAPGAGAGAPLVVVLHGCTQRAADMVGAGWNALADEMGFHVVYPEQTAANNAQYCFNWTAGLKRGQGENQSIKSMVDKMALDQKVDPKRVFAVGFSSGGAEAAILLATWPDVFAAGATFGGIPYDCAESLAASSACIKPGKDQDAATWAALVKAANPSYTGAWPRVSIWQGTADAVVDPSNTIALMRQWTGVHGIGQTPSATGSVQGYPHATYEDGSGQVLVETYAISGQGHGVFIDPAGGCGVAAPYVLDAKICGPRLALSFFGVPASPALDGGTPGPDAGDGGAPVDAGAVDGGARDASAPSPHDAGKPGAGGYGGSSGGSSPTPPSAGAFDAGVADFGTGGPKASCGLAGCSVAATPEGPARPFALVLGALVALFTRASARRRSRKVGG